MLYVSPFYGRIVDIRVYICYNDFDKTMQESAPFECIYSLSVSDICPFLFALRTWYMHPIIFGCFLFCKNNFQNISKNS